MFYSTSESAYFTYTLFKIQYSENKQKVAKRQLTPV